MLKCPYDLKQSTDLVQSLSKYKGYFSQKLNKKNLEFMWDQKRLEITQGVLRKRTKLKRPHFPIPHYVYKVKKLKQRSICRKKYIGQWNGIENPDINSHI